MKKYFFVLGTNPELSLAELKAIFPNNKWELCASVAMADFSESLDAKKLMSGLGGTIKIGEMIKTVSLANRHALSDLVKKELFLEAKKLKDNLRFNFGFSFYGQKRLPGDFFKLGLAIKKDLRQIGIASRMVTSRDPILSSVVVEQNKLIEQGTEICLISDRGSVNIGKTLAVQPFKELSKRDFGRPNRDDFSGMIPPKLAQIMINLARRNDADFKDKTILDPFCGSGTVLMEAYLLGFKNIIGSDLSDKAVSDSVKNIDWIIDFKKDEKKNNIKIFQSDVLLLEKSIEKIDKTIELHRPYVDDVHIKCPKCGKTMYRTPEVIDCWFDSGSMPFAQRHYPFEHKNDFDKFFPADFICEGIDQTRGWFYSLMAISTFVMGKSPYKTVLVNDHIQDKFGLKMSKSKGNGVNPFELFNEYGADAVIWYSV
jgi:tRNA G10  N-methylase Trm11